MVNLVHCRLLWVEGIENLMPVWCVAILLIEYLLRPWAKGQGWDEAHKVMVNFVWLVLPLFLGKCSKYGWERKTREIRIELLQTLFPLAKRSGHRICILDNRISICGPQGMEVKDSLSKKISRKEKEEATEGERDRIRGPIIINPKNIMPREEPPTQIVIPAA